MPLLRLELLDVLLKWLDRLRQRIIQRAVKEQNKNVSSAGLRIEATERGYTIHNLTFGNLSELNYHLERIKEHGYGTDLTEVLEYLTAQAIFKDYSNQRLI